MMLAAATSAPAQTAQASPTFDIKGAVKALDGDTSARPLGTAAISAVKTAGTAVLNATLPVQRAVASITGNILQTAPASAVTVKLAPEIAREANWLFRNGWPLYALVDRYAVGAPLDDQAHCIAVAVYHEARGESLEGQLAVAQVIMNRAASGKYPPSWCGTVKQPWQFSFVNPRSGEFPHTDFASGSWRKAVAITRLAVSNAIPTLSNDVLWYHADYVAPSWGRRLTRVDKIGTHIFYRA